MKKIKYIAILFLIVSAAKISVQLSTHSLISLDSWTIYHILSSVISGHEVLPRAVLYYHYPLSYIFLLPFAKLFGIMFTLKFIYPLITSLIVVPVYYLMSIYVDDYRSFIGALTIAFIDDFILRATAATPQGIALIFFFSAILFLLKGENRMFLFFGILSIFTHHLTSLILLVFAISSIYSRFIQYKETNISASLYSDIRALSETAIKEKILLLYIALFFFSWIVISSTADKNIVSLYLAIKAAPAILLLILALFFTLKHQALFLRAMREIRQKNIFIASLTIFFALLFFVLNYSTHSFLSSYSYSILFLIPAYIMAPVTGSAYLLSDKDRTWVIFFTALMIGFILIILLRLNCIFDVYRFVPFTLAALVIVVVKNSRRLAHLLLAMVLTTFISHLLVSYGTLTYNDKQMEAAEWARKNLEQATVATDTKMSALFMGISNKSTTFEGTYWLFSQDNLLPWINAFNKQRFIRQPIRYIATSSYMFDDGASISWSAKRYILTDRNIENFNKAGTIIFRNSDVVIWEVDESRLKEAGGLNTAHKQRSVISELISRIFSIGGNIKKAELSLDPRIAYGSTCE